MRDDSGRAVPPGAFLPTVERCNLSVRYDRWVIGAALQWMQAHASAMGRVSRFFINLSRDSVIAPETGAFVRQAIAQALTLLQLLDAAPTLEVVPIALDESWRIVRHGLRPVPFGTRVRIRIGDPIPRAAGEDRAALLRGVEAWIRGTLEGWRAF